MQYRNGDKVTVVNETHAFQCTIPAGSHAYAIAQRFDDLKVTVQVPGETKNYGWREVTIKVNQVRQGW
jgi:hypothetical protein